MARRTTQLGEATSTAGFRCRQSMLGRSDQPGSQASGVCSRGWEQRERLRKRRPSRAIGLLLVLFGASGLAQTNSSSVTPEAPAAPRIVFSKSFPGSQPEFYRITLGQNGRALYETRESASEPVQSFPFAASPALSARIFQLARQLNYFSGKHLEAKAKVSFMGTKTLAYEDPSHHGEQSFNYTTVPQAWELTQTFERIAETGEHAQRLAHTMRYDRLGVLKELSGITHDWHEHQLLELQLLTPTLEKAALDPNLMDIARKRADSLLAEMNQPQAR